MENCVEWSSTLGPRQSVCRLYIIVALYTIYLSILSSQKLQTVPFYFLEWKGDCPRSRL
jgi:hypothetical protein